MTREEQTDWLCRLRADLNNGVIFTPWNKEFTEALTGILEQEPKTGQYEKHIDHTDCLWYGSGDCPVTCSQYRDGWNDAMDYIYKDGKGYQPFRRE